MLYDHVAFELAIFMKWSTFMLTLALKVYVDLDINNFLSICLTTSSLSQFTIN